MVSVAETLPRYRPAPCLDSVVAIERRLADAGLGVALRRSGTRCFAGGPNVLLAPDLKPDDLTRSAIARSSRAGLQPSVHLQFEPGAESDVTGYDVQEALSTAGAQTQLSLLRLAGAEARQLRARLVAAAGSVRGYLFVDPALDSARPERISARAWQTVRDALSVPGSWLPAMHAGVRSHCPLLAAENSATVTPGTAIAAPAHSAWLPLVLDLVRFSDAAGDIDRRRLAQALDAAVECGDALLDHLDWCSPLQAEDARRNRRLAVCVLGIGDIVVARRSNPSSLACLRDLDRLLGHIHDGLWRRSRKLAACRGALPALTEHQPSASWRDESHRQDWARRWRQAVDKVQVRNRNLLVLSPYTVLPRRPRPAAAFADLLPLLAHADALSFAAPRLCLDWQVSDFKSFYARLRAQVDRLNATSFIAASA